MNGSGDPRFSGTIAVVTGGANGMGCSCVKLLAERGAQVVVADRDVAAANAVAKELEELCA